MTTSGKTTSTPSSESGATPVQLDLFIPEDQLSSPTPRLNSLFFSARGMQALRNSFMKSGTPFTIVSIPLAGSGATSRLKPSPC